MSIINKIIFALLLAVTPAKADGIFNGGSGSGGGSGTVTSISAGCGSTTGGGAITTSGTISATQPVDAAGTGNNYPIPNADCGYLVDLSNALAQTPTIAQAGTGGNFPSGWYADVCNIGVGTQTLTPATSTINGAASIALIKGQCFRVVSDGTNYQAAGSGLFGTTGSGNLVYATGPTLTGVNNAYAVTVTGGSVTGSGTNGVGLDITGTMNSSGAVDGAALFASLTNTASAAGTSLVDIQVGGKAYFSVDTHGGVWTTSQGSLPGFYMNANNTGFSNYYGLFISQGGGVAGLAFNASTASQTTFSVTSGGIANVVSGGVWGWANSSVSSNNTTQTFLTSPAAASVQIGAVNTTLAAAPVAQTLRVQSWASSTSADQNGANWTVVGSLGTGAGTAGNIAMTVGKTGTTGTTQQSAFPLLTLNPGNATGATVQFGDGTNFTTYDSCTALTTGATGVVACTGSAARFKNLLGTVTPQQASLKLDDLRIGAPVWEYKGEYKQFGEGERVGLIADDVAKMDSRCVVERDGKVADYWDRCVIAYLVADRQELRTELAEIKRQLAGR